MAVAPSVGNALPAVMLPNVQAVGLCMSCLVVAELASMGCSSLQISACLDGDAATAGTDKGSRWEVGVV